jgi:hypothetical protein
MNAARSELLSGGIEVSKVKHFDNGSWIDGPGRKWNSFISFSDPDGNSWVVQESPNRF